MLMRKHGIRGGHGADHDGSAAVVGEMREISEVE
jgi:hypothetical protein